MSGALPSTRTDEVGTHDALDRQHSLRFKYLAVFLPVVVLIFGGLQLRDAPVDVFPEFAPPKVEIQTLALGLSPSEVEQLVTVPLEDALNGVADLDVIRSKSVPDLSAIQLIFEPGHRPDPGSPARRGAAGRRHAIAAHVGSPPIMLQPLSATSRAMKIGLTSESTRSSTCR